MPKRLKSLELQGYKTFASRFEFDFSGTVTAIVGPNGSGKSNIVDALRWVLGEQSYSLLRGKRTEDMIFSGSEQRSRAGMASATVIFDNEDGWLPIDFSEVGITRRAYRDGQNEYLLNGQRVRLKDVSELLAQAGLAERTYTIIGQGLVDAALSLRADERRRLFEEAAGIGLHRSRREEALRRLETTKRNLERVLDIMAELQPRLRSLERQAKRMLEYEQAKADLQLVLREWYGYHFHRAQAELIRSQEGADAQEQQLESARRLQNERAADVAALREQVYQLRTELNGWHRSLASLHEERERISRELAVTLERLRSLQQQGRNTDDETLRLQEELGIYQQRLEQTTVEAAQQEHELAEAKQQAELAVRALQQRQSERQKVESQLTRLAEEQAQLQSKNNQNQARITERQLLLERRTADLETSKQSAEKAQSALERARQETEKKLAALDQARQQVSEAESHWRSYESRLSQLQESRRQTSEALAGISAELTSLKAHLNVLDQAENSLAGYAEGARLLLQAARQAQLKGALGPLSGRLEVPEELETAVAAVLGDVQDAVVLQDEPGVDQALDMLAGKTHRAALLPMRELKPAAPVIAPPDEACLGVASQLVQASVELQPAVNLLLGQCLVVKDRSAARRLVRGLQRSQSVVTLQGEVFHASGLVYAGGAKKEAGSASTLGRSRQRRELAQAIERAANQSASLQVEQTSLAEQLGKLQSEGQALQNKLNELRQVERQAGREYERAVLAREQADNQSTWQEIQQKKLVGELEQIKISLKELDEQKTDLDRRIQANSELIQHAQLALQGLPLDELQDAAAHWNTQVAVMERVLASLRQRKADAETAFGRIEMSQSSLRLRLENLDSERSELELRKVTLHRQEDESARQTAEVMQVVQPAELKLAELEKALDQAMRLEEAARQALSQGEHRAAQARIQANRDQEAMLTLRRRIEDDFGLVAFEYAEEISGPTPLPLDGMVQHLPKVAELSPDLEETLKRKRAVLRRIGPINPEAQREYLEVKERFEFMLGQIQDLQKAEADIHQVIAELDEIMQREFQHTFEGVAAEFRKIFTRLFGGGSARLVLTDPDDLTNTGIDIEARLPGRRAQGLSLLSGGERSLTATALVFSLLRTSPTPFCILDEVDAMLDEANVSRFRDLLRELSEKTQFVIITHNRNTVQVADTIYGVTMGRDSTSQVISLRLDQVAELAHE